MDAARQLWFCSSSDTNSDAGIAECNPAMKSLLPSQAPVRLLPRKGSPPLNIFAIVDVIT
jgi:hypothetical protein